MTKNQLINTLAEETKIPKIEAKIIVEQFFNSISRALIEGSSVEIRGFGTFHVRTHKNKNGINPKTGAEMKIETRKLPFFRAGKEIKDLLNNKY